MNRFPGVLALAAALLALALPALAQERPVVLLSNDDGWEEPGLLALAAAFGERATVAIAAPMGNRSGSSSSITGYGEPVAWGAFEAEGAERAWWIDASPVVAMRFGIEKAAEALGRGPDVVVSGINPGSNLGASVFYSGTIGIAREGAILGLPAIAASQERGEGRDVEGAARRVAELALALLDAGPCGCYLNVNLPAGPIDAGTPLRLTTPDLRPALFAVAPGEGHVTVDLALDRSEPPPGSDLAALLEGAISVTPVRLEESDPDALEALAEVFAQGSREATTW